MPAKLALANEDFGTSPPVPKVVSIVATALSLVALDSDGGLWERVVNPGITQPGMQGKIWVRMHGPLE